MLENDDGDLASDRISQNALIYVPVRARVPCFLVVREL